uniref:Uncharacterized protein n=1 Tax=Rhizophora mucronata TaxID=61149 RepID=A0A2P2QIU7_RHIMU
MWKMLEKLMLKVEAKLSSSPIAFPLIQIL